ncbi:MAG: hypothetical protein ACI36X_09260, partial [Bacteroidaceae bacterium]
QGRMPIATPQIGHYDTPPSLWHADYNPQTVIRPSLRKRTFFLASVFPFLGYNEASLRPQNENTSVQKIEVVIIITLMTDLG